MQDPDHPVHHLEKQKVSFWRKLGGGSLTISIIFHAIILAIGVYLVVQIIPPPPEPEIDFMPKSGGGGAPAAPPSSQKVRVNMPQSNATRIAAKGVSSAFTLPEPDASSDMSALSSLDSGALSGGLGGKGSGGGSGSGNGLGVGDGMGIGISSGSGISNPFGMTDTNKNSLKGVFYDIKQTKDGKPTGMNEQKMCELLSKFTSGNWDQRVLEPYYKSTRVLRQTKFYIPIMNASGAPEAFGEKVAPVYWIALYQGSVTPAKSGRYRFVGRADNVLAVRFNNEVVLDAGDYSARMGKIIWDKGSINILSGKSSDRDAERTYKKAGYDIPVKSYSYSNSSQYNDRGALMAGKTFEARAGTFYPIEILLSELGGAFGAVLMIEEIGASYKKDTTGSPTLPLFRLDQSPPQVTTEPKGSPPFEAVGPVWKSSGPMNTDI